MPTETFVDLASLDLDHVSVDRATLDRHLAQRGTFQVVDAIIHEDPPAGVLVGIKAIRADDWWTKDHIPGRPMFPGALMIETAAQIASYDYTAHRMAGGAVGERFVGFGGVDKLRFRGLVTPGCRLVIVVKLLRAGSRMFRYAVQGFAERDGTLSEDCVFDGEVLGVIV